MVRESQADLRHDPERGLYGNQEAGSSRKNSRSACLRCQQRKTKCIKDDINQPCHTCLAANVPCVSRDAFDKRTKPFRQPTRNEAPSSQVLLDRLLQTLRSGDRAKIEKVLEYNGHTALSNEEFLAAIQAACSDEIDETDDGQGSGKYSSDDAQTFSRNNSISSQQGVDLRQQTSPGGSIPIASLLANEATPTPMENKPPSDRLTSTMDRDDDRDRNPGLYESQTSGQGTNAIDYAHVDDMEGVEDANDNSPMATYSTARSSGSSFGTIQTPFLPKNIAGSLQELMQQSPSAPRILNPSEGEQSSPTQTDHGFNIHARNFGNLSTSSLAAGPPEAQAHRLLNFSLPEHLIGTNMVTDDSPFTRIFFSYLNFARCSLSEGVPVSDVFGHGFVDVELFFRGRTAQDKLDASSWASEFIGSIETLDLFVRLGVIALWSHLIKWMLNPSQATYERIPDMIRPCLSQKLLPHNVAIDLIPHPAVREATLSRPRDWINLQGARIPWPYGLDMAIEVDAATGRRRLSAAFEAFACNKDNWLFDPVVLKEYPDLPAFGATVAIKSQPFNAR